MVPKKNDENSWMDKVNNERVLRRAKVNTMVMTEIRRRQLQFLGHVMRKDCLENLSMTGKIKQTKKKGFMDGQLG